MPQINSFSLSHIFYSRKVLLKQLLKEMKKYNALLFPLHQQIIQKWKKVRKKQSVSWLLRSLCDETDDDNDSNTGGMFSLRKMLRLLNAFTSHAILSNGDIIIYWFTSMDSSCSWSLLLFHSPPFRCLSMIFRFTFTSSESLFFLFNSVCHSMRAVFL